MGANTQNSSVAVTCFKLGIVTFKTKVFTTKGKLSSNNLLNILTKEQVKQNVYQIRDEANKTSFIEE